jgi:tetratricopeptide (TPR) repeat protein
MMEFLRRSTALSIFLVFALGMTAARATDSPQPEATAADVDRITKLIGQLGADDFGAREKAQSELAQAGLEAYDALHAAQSHHDPEIALRARYLVRSMSVRWFAENDSPRVVAILKDYGDLQEPERRSRIDRLKALDDRAGVRPLIRLARFESLDALAKYAALQVIDLGPPPTQAEKIELNKNINTIVGISKRPSAVWLRLYGKTLSEPTAILADWGRAIAAEHEVLEKNPDRTSREIVRDLYRYEVDLLQSLDRGDAATDVIRRMFDLQDGSADQLQEMVDWLLFRKSWPLALELMQKSANIVDDNPRLLYRLAAIHWNLKDVIQANAIAAKALAIRPENFNDHLVIAHELEDQPLLALWAEAEYRQVIANAMLPSRPDSAARFALSELLHDRLKELPAAETLQPICDLVKKDENARMAIEQSGRSAEQVVSRMNFFFACDFHEQQNWAKEKEHLKIAVEANPKDADVLIAMYRLPEADEAWKAMTKEKLQAAIAEFRGEVERTKAELDSAEGDDSRRSIQQGYAIDCNQYAWLVGNTFGDHQEAVRFSQESVRICRQLPEMKTNLAGFLDTLGRAFHGAGDVANAVKHQAMAVELNPVSGQIRRQLELFQLEAKTKGIVIPADDVKQSTK